MAIPTLNQGMTWGEIFTVLNQLIALVNSMRSAIGNTLVNGRIDYSLLENLPRINGVVLLGNRAQEELNIEADAEVLQAVRDFGTRVDGVTTEQSAYVLRIVSLEDSRTTDNLRINALEGEKTARDNQISDLVAEAALIVAASDQAYAAKEDAVAAKNDAVIAKTAAETAAASVPENTSTRLTNLEDRMGNAGKKVSISDDLKESRVKTNDLLGALKQIGSGDVYDHVRDIADLDVNY